MYSYNKGFSILFNLLQYLFQVKKLSASRGQQVIFTLMIDIFCFRMTSLVPVR